MRTILSAICCLALLSCTSCRHIHQEANAAPRSSSVEISWVKAVTLIETEQVKTVEHRHSRDVFLTNHDGKRFKTIEPVIGDVGRLIQKTDPTGKRISYWTE
jgi:hypothetical protein